MTTTTDTYGNESDALLQFMGKKIGKLEKGKLRRAVQGVYKRGTLRRLRRDMVKAIPDEMTYQTTAMKEGLGKVLIGSPEDQMIAILVMKCTIQTSFTLNVKRNVERHCKSSFNCRSKTKTKQKFEVKKKTESNMKLH